MDGKRSPRYKSPPQTTERVTVIGGNKQGWVLNRWNKRNPSPGQSGAKGYSPAGSPGQIITLTFTTPHPWGSCQVHPPTERTSNVL